MTTQPEIKLPPLPGQYSHVLTAAIHEYARAAVLADRAESAETAGFTFKELTMKARIVELTGQRDAWQAFAEHQQWCATCGESVNQCDEGSALRDAAAPTQEHGADDERPTAPEGYVWVGTTWCADNGIQRQSWRLVRIEDFKDMEANDVK